MAAAGFAQQPQPFSHRLHAVKKIACATCHPGAATSAKAGILPLAGCVGCHQKSGVAGPAAAKLARSRSPLRWERVYELPGWVRFAHGVHRAAPCSTCHGPVERRDVLEEEVAMHMTFCRDCHLKSKAKAGCGTCHQEKDSVDRR